MGATRWTSSRATRITAPARAKRRRVGARPAGVAEAVEFLEHADGRLAAKRMLREALARVDLITGQITLKSVHGSRG